jgi:hypothetical protein
MVLATSHANNHNLQVVMGNSASRSVQVFNNKWDILLQEEVMKGTCVSKRFRKEIFNYACNFQNSVEPSVFDSIDP